MGYTGRRNWDALHWSQDRDPLIAGIRIHWSQDIGYTGHMFDRLVAGYGIHLSPDIGYTALVAGYGIHWSQYMGYTGCMIWDTLVAEIGMHCTGRRIGIH